VCFPDWGGSAGANAHRDLIGVAMPPPLAMQIPIVVPSADDVQAENGVRADGTTVRTERAGSHAQPQRIRRARVVVLPSLGHAGCSALVPSAFFAAITAASKL
jgi:hypothetical protein